MQRARCLNWTGAGTHNTQNLSRRFTRCRVLITHFSFRHDDAEIHAINRRISVGNVDLTLEIFRVLS